jgi:hypothetical protein
MVSLKHVVVFFCRGLGPSSFLKKKEIVLIYVINNLWFGPFLSFGPHCACTMNDMPSQRAQSKTYKLEVGISLSKKIELEKYIVIIYRSI